MASWILCTIGAINWGLVGAFELDLIAKLLGASTAANVVYIVIGLGGLYGLYKMCTCKK